MMAESVKMRNAVAAQSKVAFSCWAARLTSKLTHSRVSVVKKRKERPETREQQNRDAHGCWVERIVGVMG